MPGPYGRVWGRGGVKTGTSRLLAPSALLWGALVVLGWAALSAFFGGAAAHAADDSPAEPSTITSVLTAQVKAATNAVSDTLDAVAQPLTEVATETIDDVVVPLSDPVVRAVSKATDGVGAAPEVGAPAQETASSVQEVTSSVLEPVITAVRDEPLTHAIQHVVDAVAALPLAGPALDDLGVLDLVQRTAGTVDDVVAVTGPVLAVTDPVLSVSPPSPDGPADGPVSAAIPVVAPTDVSVTGSAGPDAVPTPAPSSIDHPDPGPPFPETKTDAAGPDTPASGPPGSPGAPASPTSAAGAGGSAAGVPADAHAPSSLHDDCFTTRESVPDSPLPPSPAGSTDVSPD